jgi:hypothetical protein
MEWTEDKPNAEALWLCWVGGAYWLLRFKRIAGRLYTNDRAADLLLENMAHEFDGALWLGPLPDPQEPMP